MALEDFAPAGEPPPDLARGSRDRAPAEPAPAQAENELDLDQDLFDFPPSPGMPPRAGQAGSARPEPPRAVIGAAGRADDEPEGGFADDLFDDPAPGMAREDSPSEATSPLRGRERERDGEPDLEASLQAVSGSAVDLLDDELVVALGEPAGDESPQRERGPRGARPDLVRRSVLLTWVLVAAAATLNALVLAFAWNASRSFDATLEEMRAAFALRAVPADVPAGAAREAARPAAAAEPPAGPRPERLQTREEMTLLVAGQAIGEGRFVEARRLLFDLTAVADRIDPSRREEMEARAVALIADTYRLQGLAATAAGEGDE